MDEKREDKPPEEPEEEELLREYDWAEKHVPDDVIPKPKPDEFGYGKGYWKNVGSE